MLAILNLASSNGDFGAEAADVALEVLLVVDVHDQLAHAPLLRSIRLVERADEQTIAEHESLIERSELLHLQGEASVALRDEIFQRLDCLWPRGGDELLPLLASILDLGLVVLVCHLDLLLQLLLPLLSRLHAPQPKVPPSIARLRMIVLLSQGIILLLRLLQLLLRVRRLALGTQANLLPVLAALLHLKGQLVEVLVHLVQVQRKLQPVLGHALVQVGDGLELPGVRALPRLGFADVLVGGAAEAAQLFGVFVFGGGALAEEAGEVLESPTS
jgi:hypothetical protein